MRFEVPQFIDIEDKIFGPLTWRQFLYVGGGVGMGVVLFFTTNFIIFFIIGLPLALLAGALAFYPVNNRPFSFFLEAIVNYLKGDKFYVWKKKEDIVYKQESKTPPTSINSTNNLGSEDINSKLTIPLARRLELEVLQKPEE